MTKAELKQWIKKCQYSAQLVDPGRGSFLPASERKWGQ